MGYFVNSTGLESQYYVVVKVLEKKWREPGSRALSHEGSQSPFSLPHNIVVGKNKRKDFNFV